ncbi:hypothetical protein GM658_08065 [Pseudoduganella eburnea]|uniref:DUF883 domain-containing protein n=1 Tax=Massilia eburnea TaxID=1776165 RepID=A0A6L6QDI8_9BURK|nr:DUF883 family protein [Massilia eburnea]MTW10558.1 hypothetical protein [Massilia eburnea]
MDDPDQKQVQSQEQLIGDLRQVIENAEELLKNTDHYTGLMYQAARAKLAQALLAATEELERCEDAQLLRMIEATHRANLLYRDLSGEDKLMRAFH